MNRSVGPTLRRTAGTGVLLALGFGALTATPQQVVSLTASAAPLRGQTPLPATDQLPHRDPRPVALMASSPPATAAPTSPRPGINAPTNRRASAAPPRLSRPAPAASLRAVSVVRSGSGGANGFAYGYCTWWVAHKRYVPWRGEAAQWWWNARAYGYAEGSAPRVGSIMVMAGGGSAAPEGHVAYVESVNANGSFVVSEMNWWGVPGGGWGKVDYRTVTSMRGILGFIY